MSSRPNKVQGGESVMINFADIEELQRIPGIGPVHAHAILFARDAAMLNKTRFMLIPKICVNKQMLDAIDFSVFPTESQYPRVPNTVEPEFPPRRPGHVMLPNTFPSIFDDMPSQPLNYNSMMRPVNLGGGARSKEGAQRRTDDAIYRELGELSKPSMLLPNFKEELQSSLQHEVSSSEDEEQSYGASKLNVKHEGPLFEEPVTAPVDNTNAEMLKLLQQLTLQQAPVPTPVRAPAAAPVPLPVPISAPVQAPADSTNNTNMEILKLLKQLVEQKSEPQEATTTTRRSRRKERSPTPSSSSSRSPSPAPSSSSSLKKASKASRVRSDILRYIPKNLTFNGSGRWRTFKNKFDDYAKMNFLTSAECGTVIAWCLKGKALDYYDTVTDKDVKLSYEQVIEKLETRYGVRELRSTAIIKFNQAMQTEKESLEDWSDRVLVLASPAFRGCEEEYVTPQLVFRFCQGLVDKAAAHNIGAQNPNTLEEALEKVQWYQHMHDAVYKTTGQPKRTTGSDAEVANIMAVQEITNSTHGDDSSHRGRGGNRGGHRGGYRGDASKRRGLRRQGDSSSRGGYFNSRGSHNNFGRDQSGQGDTTAQILRKLQFQMERLADDVKGLKLPSEQQHQTEGKKSALPQCYRCSGFGHFARDCPTQVAQQTTPQETSSTTLNANGLSSQADTQSNQQ